MILRFTAVFFNYILKHKRWSVVDSDYFIFMRFLAVLFYKIFIRNVLLFKIVLGVLFIFFNM